MRAGGFTPLAPGFLSSKCSREPSGDGLKCLSGVWRCGVRLARACCVHHGLDCCSRALALGCDSQDSTWRRWQKLSSSVLLTPRAEVLWSFSFLFLCQCRRCSSFFKGRNYRAASACCLFVCYDFNMLRKQTTPQASRYWSLANQSAGWLGTELCSHAPLLCNAGWHDVCGTAQSSPVWAWVNVMYGLNLDSKQHRSQILMEDMGGVMQNLARASQLFNFCMGACVLIITLWIQDGLKINFVIDRCLGRNRSSIWCEGIFNESRLFTS